MKPIIFNTEMVKAILEGRKTQTRRVIKPQPKEYLSGIKIPCVEWIWRQIPLRWRKRNKTPQEALLCCPHGRAGDRLWVRETWCHFPDNAPDGLGENIYYRADQRNEKLIKDTMKNNNIKWKPSIFMPRTASRITLEITNIRVERVQDITNLDTQREGQLGKFRTVWNSINKKRGYKWDINPWVWVIKFEVER